MNMATAIDMMLQGRDLSAAEMLSVMGLIMSGQATDAQIGGFLIGLRLKGETVDEIASAAQVMRDLATRVHVEPLHLVDICGTGGSGSNKFNVSTASAFVAAAAGVRVAKHGNRGASSKSGSADVLEAAGAAIMLNPDQIARCIDNTGMGFLFALNHHSAMKYAIGPRKEMQVRTLFNLLGPLTNPAGAKRQLLGVYAKQWLGPVAEVLKKLGSEHVMVVHSADGLDEISISDKSHLVELKDGQITEYVIAPETFDMPSSPLSELVIENSSQSLQLLRQSLTGEHPGASNIVALNAGAAIYVSGITDDLAAGIEMAQDAIGSGLARVKLSEFVDFTQHLS